MKLTKSERSLSLALALMTGAALYAAYGCYKLAATVDYLQRQITSGLVLQ